jgi:hypothetical protein
MTYGQRIADLLQMEDQDWQRHTNHWSFWTRYLSLPLLVLAGWSRLWLGWWALVPVGLALFWLWVNPWNCHPGPLANGAGHVMGDSGQDLVY